MSEVFELKPASQDLPAPNEMADGGTVPEDDHGEDVSERVSADGVPEGGRAEDAPEDGSADDMSEFEPTHHAGERSSAEDDPEFIHDQGAADDAPAVIDYTSIRGCVDGLHAQILSGWISSDDHELPLTISVAFDDETIGSTVADIFRPDLAEAGIGDGCRAFRFQPPPRFFDGQERRVTIQVNDRPAPIGNNDQLFSFPRTLFRLDCAAPLKSTGWIWEPSIGETSVINVVIDGTPAGEAKANVYREDLKIHRIGSGRHGFEILSPPQAFDGAAHHLALVSRLTGETLAEYQVHVTDEAVREATQQRMHRQEAIYLLRGLSTYERSALIDDVLDLLTMHITPKEMCSILGKTLAAANLPVLHAWLAQTFPFLGVADQAAFLREYAFDILESGDDFEKRVFPGTAGKDQAIALLQILWSADTKNADLGCALAGALNRAERRGSASRVTNTVLATHKTNEHALLSAGDLAVRRGDLGAARDRYEAALQASPQSKTARRRVAGTKALSGEHLAAVALASAGKGVLAHSTPDAGALRHAVPLRWVPRTPTATDNPPDVVDLIAKWNEPFLGQDRRDETYSLFLVDVEGQINRAALFDNLGPRCLQVSRWTEKAISETPVVADWCVLLRRPHLATAHVIERCLCHVRPYVPVLFMHDLPQITEKGEHDSGVIGVIARRSCLQNSTCQDWNHLVSWLTATYKHQRIA